MQLSADHTRQADQTCCQKSQTTGLRNNTGGYVSVAFQTPEAGTAVIERYSEHLVRLASKLDAVGYGRKGAGQVVKASSDLIPRARK
jgi:hypothetical protein